MALKSKGGTLAEALKNMTALDKNRSHSAFEHQLRAANKLAMSLNEKKGRGEEIRAEDIGGHNGKKRGIGKCWFGRGVLGF